MALRRTESLGRLLATPTPLSAESLAIMGFGPEAPGRVVRVARSLRFKGPPHLVQLLGARYAAECAGSELRRFRLLYLVFTLLVFGTGLLLAVAGQAPGLAVSVGTSAAAIIALVLRPAWGEGVALAATALLILGLDTRQTVLISECGGCPDLITLLGVMPFLHCAMLSPRLVYAAPMLAAHAGYAAYLFLTAAPDAGGAKAVVMAVCVLLTGAHLYVAEHGRRERTLLTWRLEQAVADRDAALTEEQKYARSLDQEMRRFESAVSYICHELRNPLHGLLGALDALADGAATTIVSGVLCCVSRVSQACEASQCTCIPFCFR
jgi:signal transduction histidine kinase